MKKPYKLGTWLENWQVGKTWNVTFILTEDCNLRCTYCYLCGKNQKNRMSSDTARRGVDLALAESGPYDALICEFIGGEPFLEMDLMEEITEYLKFQLLDQGHKWLGKVRFSISTNGTLYHTEPVQRWLWKNRELVSVGITIDGNRTKHDATRVYPNGQGSYDDVVRNVPLWLEQFPGASTKSTFSPRCIPHLCDSVVHLWGLGIKEVAANVVFEDVWAPEDVIAFKEQLFMLADVAIKDEYWREYNCTFFSDNIGFAQSRQENQNWCGAGKMMAIGAEGTLYPCLRFAQ